MSELLLMFKQDSDQEENPNFEETLKICGRSNKTCEKNTLRSRQVQRFNQRTELVLRNWQEKQQLRKIVPIALESISPRSVAVEKRMFSTSGWLLNQRRA